MSSRLKTRAGVRDRDSPHCNTSGSNVMNRFTRSLGLVYILPVIEDIYLIDLKWQLLSVDAGRRWIILDDDSEYYY